MYAAIFACNVTGRDALQGPRRAAVRTCGPGEHVGEIALLLDAPRNATARTATAAHLYRLDRDAFTTFLAAGFRRGTLRINVFVDRDGDH
jgi:CRP-like cAMP-binding protein